MKLDKSDSKIPAGLRAKFADSTGFETAPDGSNKVTCVYTDNHERHAIVLDAHGSEIRDEAADLARGPRT